MNRISWAWGGSATGLLLLTWLWLAVAAATPATGAVMTAAGGIGQFVDTGQALGNSTTYALALGDLDGDSDLDLLSANGSGSTLWWNDGDGFFAGGPGLAMTTTQDAALGDVDGDGDLDVVMAQTGGGALWLNQGTGAFADSGQRLGAATVYGVALGDLDGDSDLDAFLAQDGPNAVWLNGAGGHPPGVFSDTLQALGNETSRMVALGDLDGDGDLDAVVANGSAGAEATTVWQNDGQGRFSDSGQRLDTSWNAGADLGDVDGDGDLDLLLTSWTAADTIWVNQGGAQGGTAGVLVDSGQSLSGSGSLGSRLVDVDEDGDPDAVVARWSPHGNEVWINQGGVQGGVAGAFVDSSLALDASATYGVTVGDLDADGDQDLAFANSGPNTIWSNGQPGLPNPSFAVEARQNDAGVAVYPWTLPTDAALPVALSRPSPQAVNVLARIEAETVTTETLAFVPGAVARTLTVSAPELVVSRAVTLSLTAGFAVPRATQTSLDRLRLVFIDGAQGDAACFLCYADWLLKQMGIETVFWQLHHVPLTDLAETASWAYYSGQFHRHAVELSTVLATRPRLLWQGFEVLEAWTPGIVALGDGHGDTVTVTQSLVDNTTGWFVGIRDVATDELADQIDFELAVLDPASLAGMNMDQVSARIAARVQSQVYLPVVAAALPRAPDS